MHWAHFILLVLATVYAKEDDSNEISPLNPPVNLDANLRRALLKALTELENEEYEKYNKHSNSTESPRLESKDKIIEKASASALSFYATSGSSAQSTSKEPSTTTSTTVKPIVVIQKSNGLQHKPITSVEDNYNLDPVHDAEQILTSASSSFTSNNFAFGKTDNQETRSVSNILSDNFVSSNTKTSNNNSAKRQKQQTTTIRTTTSTEESEAKVEDVQFFPAPLVVAFTVHQDETGLPKSVEPIFKPAVKTTTTKSVPKQNNLNQQTQFQQQPQQQLPEQLALQEKQKMLEAEIFRLKQQQQQQNYLIRQQQLFHEQQLQLQRQKLLDEQVRLRNNQQPFVPIANLNLNKQQFQTTSNFNNNNSKAKASLVSFQPSISLNSNEAQRLFEPLPLNAQQLPIKNAIYFRTPQFPNFSQFNTQQQPPLAGSISSFNPSTRSEVQQLPSTNSLINFNSAQSNSLAETLTAPKHNRVFRQESNTGNFLNGGFNTNFNHFNTGDLNNNNNRFFRSNSDGGFTPSQYNFNGLQPPVVNHHLNNLLYNSGIIRGKPQEDLNIVSKVLSLNHLGGDYRFASSNTNEQRIPLSSVRSS